MKNKNFHHPLTRFINNNNSPLVCTLWKREKLVGLLVYSSFVRVASSGFRIIPYSLVVVLVCAQMRSDSGIIPCSLQHGIVGLVVVTSAY